MSNYSHLGATMRPLPRAQRCLTEVLSSQMSVSGGGLDFEDSILNREERHIEGTSTEIEDQHILVLAFHLKTRAGNGQQTSGKQNHTT